MTTRLLMWSGPRNISTAMMRSFDARGDCAVVDEPFYAYYLQATGIHHPGREEILKSQPTDWEGVVHQLTGPVPNGHPIWYQKHMAQHLQPGMALDWMRDCVNAFLIREPADVAASYARTRPNLSLEDLGFTQQWALFKVVTEQWRQPAIILDSKDVLMYPRDSLRHLCTACGIPFLDRMLSWRPGSRDTDGVWAKHWYASVEASTGFQPYEARTHKLRPRVREVVEKAQKIYDALYERRIRVNE